MRLEGKRVFVTGSSRGIGRAAALACAREGASVVVHCRGSEERARETAREAEALGGRAAVVRGDWENTKDVLRACSEAWEAFGGIDILVNNAGVSLKRPFLETTDEDFERLWRTDVAGVFTATREIAGRMAGAGKGGRVLTVTSVNGVRPGAGFAAYGAAKGALETMMKAAALDLSPRDILVNTLAVGAAATDINRDVWDDPNARRAVEEGIPLGRLAMPEEIAAMIVSLVADENGYMTGSTIVLDGGLLLMRGYGNPVRGGVRP